MKIKSVINKKNGMIVLVCILIVAVCIGLVVLFSMRGQYETVEGVAADQTTASSYAGGKTEAVGRTDSSAVAKQGISVTAEAELPEALDPVRFVKQAYELKNFLAIESFASPEELPVSPVVQYAFCYLYVGEGCLVDYKPEAMTYRQATESEIREQVIRLFGSCPFELTESDLYASGKQTFEMWQPDYQSEVYATASISPAQGGGYELDITFFEDSGKTRAADKAVVTIVPAEDGSFYLASMSE